MQIINESKTLSPFEFQNANQEKVIHNGKWKDNVTRHALEGSGDIFRELAKSYSNKSYIMNTELELIKNKLLEYEGYDSWEEFIDNQKLGDCQTIAAFITLDFPEYKRIFGEIELDEPYIDENGKEQIIATHHWIEHDGEILEFSKGTLRNQIEWSDLYSVDTDNEEWRYHSISEGKSIKENYFHYGRGRVSRNYPFQIYINPTTKELGKNVAQGARGFIDPRGNIYLEGYENEDSNAPKYSEIIHEDLYDVLSEKIKFPPNYGRYFHKDYKGKELTIGIMVQRVETTNLFTLSENLLYFEVSHYSSINVQELFRRCKMRNPSLKFDIENLITESFETGLKDYKGDYVEVYKNPNLYELKDIIGKENWNKPETERIFRGILTADDVYVFDQNCLHSVVVQELGNTKLNNEFCTVIFDDTGLVMLTDSMKRSTLYHNPKVKEFILANENFRKVLQYFDVHDIEIDFYDTDVVGDWENLKEDINIPINKQRYSNLALYDNLYQIYKWSYLYSVAKNNPKVEIDRRYQNVVKLIEKDLSAVINEVAEQLKPIYLDWLENHALLSPKTWAERRWREIEDMGEDSESNLYQIVEAVTKNDAPSDKTTDYDYFNALIKNSSEVLDTIEEYLELVANDMLGMGQADADKEQEEYWQKLLDEHDLISIFNELCEIYGDEEVWNAIFEWYENYNPNEINQIFLAIYEHIYFTSWYGYWSARGIDETRARIEETYEILENINSYELGDRTSKINWVINVSHQTGDMLDYIQQHYSLDKKTLERLSTIDKKEIAGWEEELKHEGFNEAFFGAGKPRYTDRENDYFEVYKNPNREEFEGCGDWCRGFITRKGDLYIASNSDAVVHTDILRVLDKLNDTGIQIYDSYPESFAYGVAVQRYSDSKIFGIGESYRADRIRDSLDLITRYIEAYNKNNNTIDVVIINKRIYDINSEDLKNG